MDLLHLIIVVHCGILVPYPFLWNLLLKCCVRHAGIAIRIEDRRYIPIRIATNCNNVSETDSLLKQEGSCFDHGRLWSTTVSLLFVLWHMLEKFKKAY